MSETISKNTIVVLVILTVVISLLGTWTVISEVNKIQPQNQGGELKSTNQAMVKLNVIEQPEPEESQVTGWVVLQKIA